MLKNDDYVNYVNAYVNANCGKRNNLPNLIKMAVQKQLFPGNIWNSCSEKFGIFAEKYCWWRHADFQIAL